MSRFQIFIIAALMLCVGLAGGTFLSNSSEQDRLRPNTVLPPAVITVPAAKTGTAIRETPVDARTLGQTFVGVSRTIRPAVVSLSAERRVKHPSSDGGSFRDFLKSPFGRFFGAPDEVPQSSMGSGVIVDGTSGYILTNHHVVEGATSINVSLLDNKTLKAELIGSDAKTDLAVIRIYDHESELPYAVLGDSDNLEVGEWVVAVGNPFGLSHTITAGIVSGRGRVLNPQNYEDFIQTDAAINPGNSGGALVDLNGQVVGINTAIASNNGYFQGAGFAIPINQARMIMQQLIQTGYVARGYMGIRMETLSADAAEGLGIERGILIHQVEPDTPAEEAGLQGGDIIVAFQGETVNESGQFRNAVAALRPGTGIDLRVWRDGAYQNISLTLGELDPEPQRVAATRRRAPQEELGISVTTLTEEKSERYGQDLEGGVVVSGVQSGSLAYRSGLQAGDLIEQINHIPVPTTADYNRVIDAIQPGQVMLLFIRRDAYNTRIVTVRKPE